MVLGTAMQTYGAELADEQEVLTRAADVIIDVFAAESALLRAVGRRWSAARSGRAGVHQRCRRRGSRSRATDALAAMAEGDTLRTLIAALRRLLKVTPVNTVALRRELAAALAERRVYPF